MAAATYRYFVGFRSAGTAREFDVSYTFQLEVRVEAASDSEAKLFYKTVKWDGSRNIEHDVLQ
jgi:hypothetical protein